MISIFCSVLFILFYMSSRTLKVLIKLSISWLRVEYSVPKVFNDSWIESYYLLMIWLASPKEATLSWCTCLSHVYFWWCCRHNLSLIRILVYSHPAFIIIIINQTTDYQILWILIYRISLSFLYRFIFNSWFSFDKASTSFSNSTFFLLSCEESLLSRSFCSCLLFCSI